MSGITVKSFMDLTPAELATWAEIQSTVPDFENPYFRPEFAQAVAAVRDDVEVAVLSHADRPVGFLPFQRSTMQVGRPVGGRLNDFHGVIVRPDVDWSAEEIVRACGLSAFDFDHLLASQVPFAPHIDGVGPSGYVDLSQGYEAYVAERRASGSDRIPKVLSRARKLERESGPLEFTMHDEDPVAFVTLLSWKSEQFRSTGLADVFAYPWTVQLLRHVLANSTRDFGALVSTLRVQGRLIAISYALRSGPSGHGWFMAYDREFATYSPGVILQLKMAEAYAADGLTRFHFGKGEEQYKLSLVSGSVPLATGSVECDAFTRIVRHAWRKTRDLVRQSGLERPAKVPIKVVRQLREWLSFR